jgi:hypothetical protein
MPAWNLERDDMHHSPSRRIVFIACGTLLAGCVLAGEPAGPAASRPAGPDVETGDPHVSSDGMKSAIEAAFVDAGKQTGLGRSELQLQSAEVVTWRDGSLGCPAPGGMYTQALVSGYRIRIRAGARELDYHASTRGALVLCPAGRAVDPIQGEAM